MMVCSRRSEDEYKSQGIHEASISGHFYLFWRKETGGWDQTIIDLDVFEYPCEAG